MSSPTTAPSPTVTPSHGSAIEYRAYARQFFPGSEAAVLFLAATCHYGSQGWTISLQETATGFELVEQPPAHAEPQIVAYYSASLNSSQQEGTVPKHVTISDSFGQHRVHVKPW
jgi:hypothetical protein